MVGMVVDICMITNGPSGNSPRIYILEINGFVLLLVGNS